MKSIIKLCLVTSFLCSPVLKANDLKSYLKKFLKERDFYSRTNLKKMVKGEALANSDVKDPGDQQTAWVKAAALHSRVCKPVLEKFTQYENYKDFYSFIDKSSYKDRLAKMEIQVDIVKKTLVTGITVDRVTKPGVYPLSIDVSFGSAKLEKMLGKLEVVEQNGRCLFYTELSWKGKDTGLMNFMMEQIFITIGKSGINQIFKITGHKMQ